MCDWSPGTYSVAPLRSLVDALAGTPHLQEYVEFRYPSRPIGERAADLFQTATVIDLRPQENVFAEIRCRWRTQEPESTVLNFLALPSKELAEVSAAIFESGQFSRIAMFLRSDGLQPETFRHLVSSSVASVTFLGSAFSTAVSLDAGIRCVLLLLDDSRPSPVTTVDLTFVDLKQSLTILGDTRDKSTKGAGGMVQILPLFPREGQAIDISDLPSRVYYYRRSRPLPLDLPWNYFALDPGYRDTFRDVVAMGDWVTLGDTCDMIAPGRSPKSSPSPTQEKPDERFAVWDARSIAQDVSPQRSAPATAVEPALRLVAGDILIRRASLLDSGFLRLGLRVARQILQNDLPATCDGTCMIVRLKGSLGDRKQQLIADYLESDRALWALLGESGMPPLLSEDFFRQLKVPLMRDDLDEAMKLLEHAEEVYTEWSYSAFSLNQDLREEPDYEARANLLFRSARKHRDRLKAALEAEDINHRVRKTFPTPLALLHERLLVENAAEVRIRISLQLAEWTLRLAVVPGLLQLNHDARLSFRKIFGARSVTWGGCVQLLDRLRAHAVRSGVKEQLPFPEYAALGPIVEKGSDWYKAEQQLAEVRNHLSHLGDWSQVVREQQADACAANLRTLMAGIADVVSMIVGIGRSSRLTETGTRIATVDMRQGARKYFPVEEHTVDEELLGDSVICLPTSGPGRSAYPWAISGRCEDEGCEVEHIFVLDRMEGNGVYKSVGDGHARVATAQQREALAPWFEK